MDWLTKAGSVAIAPLKRRMIGGPDVHFDHFYRVGGGSALFFIGLWVHDRLGEGGFASDFRGEIIQPVALRSVRLEPREHNFPKETSLPVAFAPYGASQKIDLIMFFDDKIPDHYQGRLCAVGREGLKPRWREFLNSDERPPER